MKKIISVASLLLCLLFIVSPLKVNADCSHNWESEDYCVASGDGKTHKVYYECTECGEEKYEVENCTWEYEENCEALGDGKTHKVYYQCAECSNEKYVVESCTFEYYYSEANKDGKTHTSTYYCKKCDDVKEIKQNCNWKFSDMYYEELNSTNHYIEKTYECKNCDNEKTVKTKTKHVIIWRKDGSDFSYKCKYCGFEPYYSGSPLYDCNATDHYTLKKGKKVAYTCFNYMKSINPISSVKSSNKKICTVTKKGKRVIIKGKKKGKCTITVKMKSGAVYKLKMKVK